MKLLIGEMLVKNGLITEEQLKQALEMQHKENRRLGEILIELGYISTKELVWMISEQASVPFVDLEAHNVDAELVSSLPKQLLYKKCVLPLYTTEDKIFVVLGDPSDQSVALKIKEIMKKDVVISGGDPRKIRALLDVAFEKIKTTKVRTTRKKKDLIIRITESEAQIESYDESGQVTKKTLPVDLTIKIGEFEL